MVGIKHPTMKFLMWHIQCHVSVCYYWLLMKPRSFDFWCHTFNDMWVVAIVDFWWNHAVFDVTHLMTCEWLLSLTFDETTQCLMSHIQWLVSVYCRSNHTVAEVNIRPIVLDQKTSGLCRWDDIRVGVPSTRLIEIRLRVGVWVGVWVGMWVGVGVVPLCPTTHPLLLWAGV